ncbi:polysaccharide biosynthesis protein, partial [Schnuerera sp.]|uniref:polysaccharide biosynthesis protein n=1 Tax=Schnuerera sp. TaxID=2794844 RepID=UPI002C40AC74
LAKELIKLSGFEPNVDIPIKIVGLRPGEKLFEELLLAEEGISKTKHDKIFIGRPTFFDYKLLLNSIDSLREIIDDGTDEDIKKHIKTMVPTYRKDNPINDEEIDKSIVITSEGS